MTARPLIEDEDFVPVATAQQLLDTRSAMEKLEGFKQLAQNHGMTEDELVELVANMSSKYWRLNNLYTIKDKDGKERILKLNRAQRKVLKKFRHNKKIILKSRQQGISTLYLAYNLDSCIFNDGYEAGIQSYGKDESKKLNIRAKLMWDKFPSVTKSILDVKLTNSNESGMYFSNRSILKIGNFRGDTLQSLHVSELGKIAKKFPDKAQELQTGAFQAVSVNNIITIESTAEGRSGLFWEMWRKAEIAERAGVELSPLDFQPIFLSWVYDPDCWLEIEKPIIPKHAKYFKKLGKELGIELEPQQKWWWVAKEDELGFKIFQEYPATPKEAFDQSVEGTYYREEYKNLKIIKDAYQPELLVNMAFDLGMNDTFSIGFFQCWTEVVKGKTVRRTRIIGYYENSGKGLKHYKEVCNYLAESKGWVFNETAVPHDVAVKELIADKTRWQALLDLGFNPRLVPKHRIQDGIEATREFLSHVEIDGQECGEIIDAIQNYKKKYDEKLEVYLESPVHDKYSHPADMLRYMAMYVKNYFPSLHYVRDLEYKSIDEEYEDEPSGFDV